MSKATLSSVLIAIMISAMVSGLAGLVSAQGTFEHLKVFTQVLRYVKAYYVEDEEPRRLVNDAIRGMLEELDPYSQFVEADSMESLIRMQADASRETGGTAQFFVLRRERGTKVGGKSVPEGILLEDGKTGYVAITRFNASTPDELETVLKNLEAKGMKRLILDLRDNPGGLLAPAIEVADSFIDDRQVVVYTKGRIDGSSQHYYATDSPRHPHHPLIVLVNQKTASGSEIVAGAIQDQDRGLVAGTATFGLAAVQRQYMLEDGSALLLTVANFHTPSGRLIQRPFKDNESAKADSTIFYTLHGRRPVRGGGGITPDVSVESPTGTRSKDLAKDPMVAEALRHFPEAEKMAKTYAALPKEKR